MRPFHGTFPVIQLKLATPPLPPQTTLLGGGGGVGNDGMNPKPNKKLLLGAESYVTITWKGFFTQSQVLLPSIIGLQRGGGRKA